MYNSNAIENSTLTLEETEKLLLQINLDRYITEREIFEAKNLARVVSYIDTKAKEHNISHSNLINKANRQTIEAFFEKGVWKIGVPQN